MKGKFNGTARYKKYHAVARSLRSSKFAESAFQDRIERKGTSCDVASKSISFSIQKYIIQHSKEKFPGYCQSMELFCLNAPFRQKKGTKVADIAWCSEQRFKIIARETECSIAPKICIEVMSSSNTEYEMEEKRQLYFSAGALECWICDEDGNIEFFSKNGELVKSELAPSFPNKIKVAC